MAKNHLLDNSVNNNEHRLVTITNGVYQVIAHVPESFTLGVGSEISAPFSGFTSNGVVASGAAMLGYSSRSGIATRKTYMGPDQPDISLELEFEAYYSAYEEVMKPTYNLMMMASGSEKGLERELNEQGVVSSNLGTGDFIKFLRTPGTCSAEIGNILTLDNVYLGDVSITYGTVLDSEGYPMEAQASVTLVPQSPLTKGRIKHAFGNRF